MPSKPLQMNAPQMYRHKIQQPEFEAFYLPFGGHLRSDNRWVRMAKLIPWAEAEQRYAENFADSGMGAPAKNVRIALGALIIKERLGLSDEETVQQIRENPYLQYFLGYEGYRHEPPFEAAMMVHFRKRLGVEDLNWMQERVARRVQPTQRGKDTDGGDDNPPTNSGKLIVDATVAPADIKYPTDVNLLNEAREKTEAIIDTLHRPLRGREPKVRTYRKKARKEYLKFAKKRKHSERAWRKAVGKMLRYVKRNLRHIQQLASRVGLSRLSRRQYRNLLVVAELVRQQEQMHQNRSCSVPGRIVSISQPHVRPIVRGKAAAPVEFGAKLSLERGRRVLLRGPPELGNLQRINRPDSAGRALPRTIRTLPGLGSCGQDLSHPREPVVLQRTKHSLERPTTGSTETRSAGGESLETPPAPG